MRSINGTVTTVQEGRFRLVDDNGGAPLFLLHHGAAAEPEQLPQLQHRQSRVRVGYTHAPGLLGHVARRIVRAIPRSRPALYPAGKAGGAVRRQRDQHATAFGPCTAAASGTHGGLGERLAGICHLTFGHARIVRTMLPSCSR
jgi:hypothetical protein